MQLCVSALLCFSKRMFIFLPLPQDLLLCIRSRFLSSSSRNLQRRQPLQHISAISTRSCTFPLHLQQKITCKRTFVLQSKALQKIFHVPELLLFLVQCLPPTGDQVRHNELSARQYNNVNFTILCYPKIYISVFYIFLVLHSSSFVYIFTSIVPPFFRSSLHFFVLFPFSVSF